MPQKTKQPITVYISGIIFGFGCLIRKQTAKGTLYLIAEISIVHFMITKGISNLSKLLTLGTQEQTKIWDQSKNIYIYVDGDRSLVILLYGIVTISILILFLLFAHSSVKSAITLEKIRSEKGNIPSFIDEIKELFNNKLHYSLLFLPVLGILIFTVLPLVFMVSMAFTNYSLEGNKLVLFDWVGIQNFKKIYSLTNNIGSTFWSVLGWTIIWALSSTLLNFFLGMLLALLINWKKIALKNFWRFCFVFTVAIPHFVTLLVIKQMLQPEGAINILLRSLEIIGVKESLPFFTDVVWSRITVILINAWVGIPYVLLQITGVLQNIPPELYDAAKIDGAGPFTVFKKITLPYTLFVTTPFLIVSFTGNINNFNVIFLTSRGYPQAIESTAGKTDLLITWLYKLTIENQYFNIGAVIGIMTFITLAVISLFTFRYSSSYKNEEYLR